MKVLKDNILLKEVKGKPYSAYAIAVTASRKWAVEHVGPDAGDFHHGQTVVLRPGGGTSTVNIGGTDYISATPDDILAVLEDAE